MKFVLFALALLVAHVAAQSHVDAEREFSLFMNKYNKQYATKEERDHRFAIFKESLQRAAHKNAKSKGAVYGVTKFSDLTPQEFRETVLMKNPIVVPKEDVVKAKTIVQHNRKLKQVLTRRPQVPSALDWRDKGAVTPVKNQEQCGSCWAFSVTENIESMWILAGNATNSTVDLAPQQIVDCDTSDMGCNGGNPPTAYEYVINAGGMESESSYPYTGEDGSCNFKKQEVVAKISNWKYATTWYSETTLQDNLVKWGPLSICLDAANWQDYKSGVMTWEECAWINILDHCVQLVGYNQNDSNNPYWIVRNSWGTDWGINGYIWLEMWEDTCGLAHEATTAVV